ncbi:MAG: hypothetical protein M3Y59_25355 [Myxococcota bacterium]|nr:hypothetical protein [Myxococcota bacterium]
MRLGPLLLLVLSPAAFAQSGTLTVEFQEEVELVVGPTQCDATIPLDWTATVTGGATPCTDLRLWVTSRTTCGDAPQGSDLDRGTVTATELAAGSGRKSFLLSELTGISGGVDAGTGCGALGFEQTFIGCGRYVLPSGFPASCSTTTAVTNSSIPKLIYDAKAPAVPVLDAVVPLDGALQARVTTGADAVTVILFVKETSAPEAAYAQATTFSAEAGSGRIEGLVNGTPYSVKAYAEDLVSNRSAVSAELGGTPQASEGFFGNYRRMGGAEEGGCSAVGGGSMISALMLVVLGASCFRRRR